MDEILGVVSATAIVAAGDTPFTWQGRFMRGEFGEILYHDIPDPDWQEYVEDMSWTPSEDQSMEDRPLIPNPTPRETVRVPVENPEYNPDVENIPRSQRPEEWSCIGLLGQVYVRVGEEIAAGAFVAADGGIGVESAEPTRLRCMEMTQSFDAVQGCGVALCLLR